MLSLLASLAALAILSWLWRRRRAAPRSVLYGGGVASLTLVAIAGLSAPPWMALEKCVAKSLMPVGWLWLAALAVTAWAWHTERPRWAAAGIAAWLAIGALGSPVLGEWLVGSLESTHARRPFEAGQFDAVIVLGGGTSSTPWGNAQLGEAGDRLMLAARLYHRGQTPLLVTSGSPMAGVTGHSSVDASRTLWQEVGVPPESIVDVEGARNTREESVAHAALIRERGWERVAVVSSAIHLPRAMALFERQGVDVVALPADFRGDQAPPSFDLFSVIPEASGFYLVERALWEHLGRAVGR